jgi:hypothetical protein
MKISPLRPRMRSAYKIKVVMNKTSSPPDMAMLSPNQFYKPANLVTMPYDHNSLLADNTEFAVGVFMIVNLCESVRTN